MAEIAPIHSKIKVRNFDGFKVPNFTLTLDRFREGINYKPDQNDIFINTYPKSGTTWMIYIVWSILNEGATPPAWQEMNRQFASEIEVEGTDRLSKMAYPRVIKTHLQSHFLPKSTVAKYIYVARNPWDTCMSYYNYAIQRPEHFGLHMDTSFENFVLAFAEGELPYGYYFTHIAENYRKRHNSNVLFINYEEMKENLKTSTVRIAKFLGQNFHDKLFENDAIILSEIVQHCSFDYMRQISFHEKEDSVVKEIKFFQKGCAGYAKSQYGENEKNLMEEKICKYFPDAEFQDLLEIWKRY